MWRSCRYWWGRRSRPCWRSWWGRRWRCRQPPSCWPHSQASPSRPPRSGLASPGTTSRTSSSTSDHSFSYLWFKPNKDKGVDNQNADDVDSDHDVVESCLLKVFVKQLYVFKIKCEWFIHIENCDVHFLLCITQSEEMEYKVSSNIVATLFLLFSLEHEQKNLWPFLDRPWN